MTRQLAKLIQFTRIPLEDRICMILAARFHRDPPKPRFENDKEAHELFTALSKIVTETNINDFATCLNKSTFYKRDHARP